MERCSICGCKVHRDGDYAKPTVKGRSHATKHHYVAERFFGRSANRRGDTRDRIFQSCPWSRERETAVYCYECHEELLRNPVLLPEDIKRLRQLVELNGLTEERKTRSRERLGGRIKLFHDAISLGIEALLKKQRSIRRR